MLIILFLSKSLNRLLQRASYTSVLVPVAAASRPRHCLNVMGICGFEADAKNTDSNNAVLPLALSPTTILIRRKPDSSIFWNGRKFSISRDVIIRYPEEGR